MTLPRVCPACGCWMECHLGRLAVSEEDEDGRVKVTFRREVRWICCCKGDEDGG